MPVLFGLGVLQTIFGIAMFLMAVFLILLVLVQRGRGGGLAGALGGAGGESALGTKAGDTFTRVTVVVAAVWILLCMLAIRTLSVSTGPLPDAANLDPEVQAPITPGAGADDDAAAGDDDDTPAEDPNS